MTTLATTRRGPASTCRVLFDLLGSDGLGSDQAFPCPLDQGPVQLALGGAGEGNLTSAARRPSPDRATVWAGTPAAQVRAGRLQGPACLDDAVGQLLAGAGRVRAGQRLQPWIGGLDQQLDTESESL
jgi:hypothetical protein